MFRSTKKTPNSPNTITQDTRRSVLDYLLLDDPSFDDREKLMTLLRRVWDLGQMPSTDGRFQTAEGDIYQHIVRNDDWTLDDLLINYLKLLSDTDERFKKFLEESLHPLVLSDPREIAKRLTAYNQILQADNYQIKVHINPSNRTIYKVDRIETIEDLSSNLEYEVVLSYASEDRHYVEQVAEFLKIRGVNIFYDRYSEVDMWGKDLTEHLDKVFRNSGKYCVMFISKHYANKVWTIHERRSALAKAVEERQEYVLPVRFDNTDIPGLQPSIAYIDLRQKTPEELGIMIIQKLRYTQ